MKKLLTILTVLTVVFMATSCVSQKNISSEASGFRPTFSPLLLTMQDYEYVGEVTVSAEYTRYLGIFVKVNKINDKPYDPRNKTYTYINMKTPFNISTYLHQALYLVTTTYPNADYIVPGTYKAEKKIMNGGRYVREEMSVKVFRLKH